MITAELLQKKFEDENNVSPGEFGYWFKYAKWLEKRVISVEYEYGDCDGCIYDKANCCILQSGNHCIRQAEDYYKEEE